jgi:hypothetical protein
VRGVGISTYLRCYTRDTFCKPLIPKVVLHWFTCPNGARVASRPSRHIADVSIQALARRMLCGTGFALATRLSVRTHFRDRQGFIAKTRPFCLQCAPRQGPRGWRFIGVTASKPWCTVFGRSHRAGQHLSEGRRCLLDTGYNSGMETAPRRLFDVIRAEHGLQHRKAAAKPASCRPEGATGSTVLRRKKTIGPTHRLPA